MGTGDPLREVLAWTELWGESTWLRLERRGNLLFGSVSGDGISWITMEPIEVHLPPKLQVGVNAGQNTCTGFEATFALLPFLLHELRGHDQLVQQASGQSRGSSAAMRSPSS